ncbi:hypothetical protein H1S06_06030 [Marinobacterium sp. 3-1745]|uniref:Preprotein translocase subunit YajC n=2 Tax=Marinobacterium marinum TaxID=2756129 RepID=A0A7W1WXG7_9GAMM|nr:hypothetical protein [Marinobacterium marinum]
MKWLIVALIFISLLGSVLWVRPSPRQRYQAKVRMRARALGIQVQLAHVDLPRARGELEAERVSVPAYRFVRTNLESRERNAWVEWEVHRVETIGLHNEVLPQGWSWLKGGGTLPEPVLSRLVELLNALPDDVVGVESNPLNLTLYWYERGEIERLDQLQALVQPLLDAKI